MTVNEINPYIREAKERELGYPFTITERILFDYALMYVRAGKCEIRIGKEVRVLSDGDIILIPPDSKHGLMYQETKVVDSAFISFDLKYDMYSEYRVINYKSKDDMDKEKVMRIGENILLGGNIQFYRVEDIPDFEKKYYDIIYRFQHAEDDMDILYCKGKLCEILSVLLKGKANCDFGSDDIISRVREYIDMNYTKNISLDLLSEMFYVNKFTLARNFKKRYDIGVIQYANALRLEQAKRFLKEGKSSVKEISRKLGFSTPYIFGSFFKKHVGMSAKEYRLRNKNDILWTADDDE